MSVLTKLKGLLAKKSPVRAALDTVQGETHESEARKRIETILLAAQERRLARK